MKRVLSLDYLRGLAAFGIMIFHYHSFSYGGADASHFLGKVGVFGVTIFYILSGLTLHYVYQEKITLNTAPIRDFFIKRVFRIHPLLIATTIATIIVFHKNPDWWTLFLNLTGIFGFVDWDNYIASGVWSIGNELVFYTFLPVFIILYKYSRPAFGVLAAAILGVYLYFTFFALPAAPKDDLWGMYVNPLNQLLYFFGGYFIGILFIKKDFNQTGLYVLLLAAVLAFIFFPVTGSDDVLFYGTNRVVYTLLCFVMCFCFYKIAFKLPSAMEWVLKKLGEASYSVYLLHFICFRITKLTFMKLGIVNTELLLATAILATLVSGYISYTYFEKYFMKLGKQITDRLNNKETIKEENVLIPKTKP